MPLIFFVMIFASFSIACHIKHLQTSLKTSWDKMGRCMTPFGNQFFNWIVVNFNSSFSILLSLCKHFFGWFKKFRIAYRKTTIEQEVGVRGFCFKKLSPLHTMHIKVVLCLIFNKNYRRFEKAPRKWCFCVSDSWRNTTLMSHFL